MPLLSPRRLHRLTHRAIATVIAVSLLSMPVTYRGGAEAAHAHTIFQLWADVQTGSFTHHPVMSSPLPVMSSDVETSPPFVDDAVVARLDVTGDHERAATGQASGVDRGSDTVASMSDHPIDTDQVDAEAWEPVKSSPTGTGVLELDEDAPAVSSAFTPNVRGTSLVLAAALPLSETESFFSSVRHASRLNGVAHSPTAPPPRQAA